MHLYPLLSQMGIVPMGNFGKGKERGAEREMTVSFEPVHDRFPITKKLAQNMCFTTVNFHLANGKNTSVWQNNQTPRPRPSHAT